MARYLLFNKPYHVLPSFTDPDYERGVLEAARATLADFIDIPDVYPAGRLDYDSEGLMFLTDDGQLAHKMTHPRYDHPKTYLVQVEGAPTREDLEPLRRGGLEIKTYLTAPAEARVLEEPPDLWPRHPPIRERKSVPDTWIELTLTEGKKRQVRRMTAAIGYPTLRLVRSAIGPLNLGNLQLGEWRDATAEEMEAVRRMLRQGDG